MATAKSKLLKVGAEKTTFLCISKLIRLVLLIIGLVSLLPIRVSVYD